METKALLEFKKLQQNEIYSIENIEDWLHKYAYPYDRIKEQWVCDTKGCNYKYTKVCTCESKNAIYTFIQLFKKLKEFSYFHGKDTYVAQELKDYQYIKDDNEQVKAWVKRNENFGAHECFEFLIYHFDYAINPEHLLVVDSAFLGYDIFVNGKDFKNLITFLQTFNNLFWINKIHPESELLQLFE